MYVPCVTMTLMLAAGVGGEQSCSSPSPETIDINGGYSWNGWTSRGFSNQSGVWASGSTTAVYEIYTTIFTFDKSRHVPDSRAIQSTSTQIPRNFNKGTLGGNGKGFTHYNQGDVTLQNDSGRAVTNGGAFDDGNIILGIGVRVVDNAQFEAFDTTTANLDARREKRWGGWRFFQFGLNNNGQTSYMPASTVGGTDSRVDWRGHSRPGDFVMSASPGAFRFTTQEISIRLLGDGPSAGGALYIPGGFHGPNGGAVSYDFPLRTFGADVDGQVHAYQTFLDITAIQKLYGPDSVSEDSIIDIGNRNKGLATEGVGPIDLDNLMLCINGYRDNQVVIPAVPRPQVRTVTAPHVDPGYD
jgi:hypothetical protein